MVHRRQAIGIALSVAVAVSAAVGAQKKDEKKQDDAQKKEVQAVVKLADDSAAGQPAANDLGLAWMREDFLKAQGNKQYVPFVVTLDPSKVAGGNVVFYWRVVSKNAAPPPAPAPSAAKDDKKDKDKKPPKIDYAYEDVAFIPVTAAAPAAASTVAAPAATAAPAAASALLRIARSFTVPAGPYDVYLVAKELTAQQKGAAAPKTSVVKQTINVPDFWNGELNTSTVLIAERIDPLPAPLTPQQQADRPYALGQMEIVPQIAMTFGKKTDLSTFMLIYNPKTDSANKPDVTVEYSFYQKQAGAEKFFNKTNPTILNAGTLPPQFDLAAGHQLQAGQAVPLATFPEGEYRLEIKVTDKLANKTLTRELNFTVSAS